MPYTVPIGPMVAEASRDAEPIPTILSFAQASASLRLKSLLEEAIDLAWRLGFEVIEQPSSAGCGFFWVRGRKRLLLDPSTSIEQQLTWVAEALCDDPRLVDVPMSKDLSEYLQPRRAA